jgi:hypothetical protein
MAAADEFVVYDSVQYTKNDWRNRNRIPTKQGSIWLTIPVATAGLVDQSIAEAHVQDHRWAAKHWRSIEQSLGRRPYFDRYRDDWAAWYRAIADFERLHEINVYLLERIAAQLGVTTRIVSDSTYLPLVGSATDRLVSLCVKAGATHYLSGPAGLAYIDRQRFADAGIELEVIDYSHYPEYPQAGPAFDHAVTVLDVLANVGPEARGHLIGAVRPA